MLALVSDWDAWVSRRVDSFQFVGDDERVLRRHQSIDFVLPPALADVPAQEVEQVGGLPVPLTFVSKWRLPEFSLRDESGAAVSLLRRTDSVRIGAAMLDALGTSIVSHDDSRASAGPGSQCMPDRIRAELEAIADAEPADALRRCVELPRPAGEGDARAELGRSELFMSLAYELAVGFPLIALLPADSRRSRYLLKLSYSSYVVPAENDRLPVRLKHGLRWLKHKRRDAVDPVEWRRSSSLRRIAHDSPDPAATGTLVISTTCSRDATRLRLGAPLLACGTATIVGPGNRRLTVRVRPSGVASIVGLPEGRYRLELEGESGFELRCMRESWTARPGQVERLHITATRTHFARNAMRAAPTLASPAWQPKRWLRGGGWSSKPLAIRVRMGDGGSYHCEFEAPAGLHVTRAKLLSNLDGNTGRLEKPELPGSARNRARYVDTVLESTQRVALYSPRGSARASTGYAIINLRPRVETVVRPAFFTALITLVVIVALAIGWNGEDGFGRDATLVERVFASLTGEDIADRPPSWGLLAVLLGAPSALAAYFAQAVPSRVTNAMLYGVRLTALLPVLLSLLTAAALISSPSLGTDWLLTLVVALAVLLLIALGFTYRFTEHPPEQKPVAYRQGSDFEAVHLGCDPGGKATWAGGQEFGEETDPDAIRDRMLERIGGLTGATRRKLLGQHWFHYWEREVPPALYFDSAESPAVFLGPHSAKNSGELRSRGEDLLDDVLSEVDSHS